MFNLSTLKSKDTFDLHLRHPVTEELLYATDASGETDLTKPVKITLYSTSSKQYRTAINAMQNRQLKRGKKQASAEVMREEGIELLVACSDSATNLSLDGTTAINNADAFRTLYSDAGFDWLKGQVDTALGDVANFIQA